ncbi:alpha/beta fold hydrolase [Hyphobacterium sp.]|uniref:alpha/beta fold hydrolase n=1 Tax=Hyphobacterium sp. TaxID=2004662 RepID=UPI003BAB55BC
MPVIEQDGRRLDYLEEGEGPRLVLIHSSVSGARQWKPVMKAFADRYQCLAPNLMGYAKTSPWSDGQVTLDDHVDAIAPVFDGDGPIELVGHSFGGMVAAKAAGRFGDKISRLILVEPNPFNLLHEGETASLAVQLEAAFKKICEAGARDDWLTAAEVFISFWEGEDVWAGMGEHHRIAFSWTLPPLIHEWEAVFPADATSLFADIACPTEVIYAADTNAVIAGLMPKVRQLRPDWSQHVVPEGGHMFPKTEPELMIALLEDRLAHTRS